MIFNMVGAGNGGGGSTETIKVKTEPGATVTVTDGVTTYTGVADTSGIIEFAVKDAGNYLVSAYNGLDLIGSQTVRVAFEQTALIAQDPSQYSFSDSSDADFTSLIQDARQGEINLEGLGWSVGDLRTIHMNAWSGPGSYNSPALDMDIVLTSFEEYEGCGNVIQFDFVNSHGYRRMNTTGTNSGGYGNSTMKTTALNNMFNAMPQYIKDLALTFDVKASAGGGGSTIVTVSGNKLALRSEVELYGTNTVSAAGEGVQVEYYKTAANRIKGVNDNTSPYEYYLRSPVPNNTKRYCYVQSSGIISTDDADYSKGVAPFGCL